jgi:hypothetical protein
VHAGTDRPEPIVGAERAVEAAGCRRLGARGQGGQEGKGARENYATALV